MGKAPNSIFLCGFMGAGKTTVGKLLAKRLEWDFVDTDEYIEKEHGPIRAIFEQYGEVYFRELEAAAAQKLKEAERTVVSTGGGFLISPQVRRLLEGRTILYLEVDFEECYRRIANSERPLIRSNTRESVLELYQKRDAVYRCVSSAVFSNIGSPEAAVQKIMEHFLGDEKE